MQKLKEKPHRNQTAYIWDAATEYFITLLITDVFLASLLTYMGVSNAMTGIIVQLSSFAFAAQLLSLFVKRTHRLKYIITGVTLINQLLFVFLYVIPLTPLSSAAKAAIFVVVYVSGHLLLNVAIPYRTYWMLHFVPNGTRGSFFAKKEIVSLLLGMCVTFGMGTVLDYFKAQGREETFFYIAIAFTFLLAVCHLFILLWAEDITEAPEEQRKESPWQTAKRTLTDTTVLKLSAVVCLWWFANGLSVSFLGTYKNEELGFSMQYSSLMFILYAIVRSVFARIFGRYADRKGWLRMTKICTAIVAISYAVNIFTVPANGKWMYALYYSIYAISMAGMNSALTNLLLDYIKEEDRAASGGLQTSLGGIAGLLGSLIGGPILSYVQKNGNTLFGIPMYGQQFLSLLSALVCVGLFFYLWCVIGKLRKREE